MSLLTGERIYLVGACGALPVCVCPDRWGFCGWSFLNPNHELNVVENMMEDARSVNRPGAGAGAMSRCNGRLVHYESTPRVPC